MRPGTRPAYGPWRAPHLSLFLLAALWAGLVPLVWLAPGLVCDPVAWHRQELVLGLAGAAMGGYLLTALPHWLQQAGAPGSRGGGPVLTRLLVAAWVAGRLAGGPCRPDAAALAVLGLFPLGLAIALALPVIRARIWARLPIALSPLLLVLIALRLRLHADGLSAVLGMSLMVALVGGRIIPAYLGARANNGASSGTVTEGSSRLRLPATGRLADLMLALALAAHLGGAGAAPTALLMLLAALGQGLRMAGWPLARGLKGGQPDLALLVLAWAWLPAGLALVAAALARPGLPLPAPGDGLHALTMGLMGSMILAVMSRAWMRRVPGALRPGPVLLLAAALLHGAALLRLALPQDPLPATLCWSAAWALATGTAAAALRLPVPRPVLSARRAPP